MLTTSVVYKYSLAFTLTKFRDCLAEMNGYLKLLEENGIKGEN